MPVQRISTPCGEPKFNVVRIHGTTPQSENSLLMTETSRTRGRDLQAIENFPPAQWGEFLNNACAADTTIRQDVEKLLNAHLDALRASDVTETFSGSRPNHDHDSFVLGSLDPEACQRWGTFVC